MARGHRSSGRRSCERAGEEDRTRNNHEASADEGGYRAAVRRCSQYGRLDAHRLRRCCCDCSAVAQIDLDRVMRPMAALRH